MKIVSEYFPWSPGKTPHSSSSSSSSQFIYTQANHKSVLGMGAYAQQAGAQLRCLSREQMQQWLNPSHTATTGSSNAIGPRNSTGDSSVAGSSSNSTDGVTLHLVAYPVKDNYEGQLYPTDWVQQAHAKSGVANQYLVLLDAAAYVPTHSLDLSQVGGKTHAVWLELWRAAAVSSCSGSMVTQQHNMCLLQIAICPACTFGFHEEQ
jgi:hypothetical protein